MFKIVASNKFIKDLKLLKKRSDSDFKIQVIYYYSFKMNLKYQKVKN